MKKIDIKFIPQSEHKYTTIGYWTFDEKTGELIITVSLMTDWRYMIAVVFHEMKEAAWCIAHGITQKECDDFDDEFEKLYESGKVQLSQEPGEDSKCPYYIGHMLGEADEALVVSLLGASWVGYLKETNALMGIADSLYETGV